MLTADEVRQALDYDPQTGVFRWKKNLGSRARYGQVTGCKSPNGALVIRLGGRLHYAHRLAWLILHGEWPSDVIDHIDGDATNNRESNLRQATQAENTRNVRRHADTVSGLKGAYRDKKRWTSRIMVNGVNRHLGTFDTAEEAHEAYKAAATLAHGGFARFE